MSAVPAPPTDTGSAPVGAMPHDGAGAPRRGRGRATSVSAVLAVASVVGGEAVVITVVGLARQVTGGTGLAAWVVATASVALAGYLAAGLPQLMAWGGQGGRNRLAGRALSGRSVAGFLAASVAGGPLAVGWYTGRTGHPRARGLTWASAWVFTAVWSAVYLGLLARFW